MPLTPEDVRQKQFTPVRLREGYDVAEVDAFLDQVEAELERLLAENNELREKLTAVSGESHTTGSEPLSPAASVAPLATTPFRTEAPVTPQVDHAEAEALQPEVQDTKPAEAKTDPWSASQAPRSTSVADASSSAVRLLEMATKHADDLVAQAKDDADKIVGAARAKADRLDNESRGRADQLKGEAQAQLEKLESEVAEKRSSMLGGLEKQKAELEQVVQDLGAYEREYRSRLRSYFTEQLKTLDESSRKPEGTVDGKSEGDSGKSGGHRGQFGGQFGAQQAQKSSTV